jgi:sulfite exporter TauE/SafE
MTSAALCNPLTLSAAFLMGLAGSVHCVAMCGGIAGALGMRTRGLAGPAKASLHAATYQLGRLTSYSLAGAFVGASGGLVRTMFDVDRVAIVARVATGLVVIGVATGILFNWRPLAPLERLGGRLWGRAAPLARKLPSSGLTGALLLGMLWGWLPCGFVYSMLLFAALSGSAAQAAAMMLCFGLGTAPAVFGASMLSARVWRVSVAYGVNKAAGWLLLGFGALMMLVPFGPHMHH